MKYIIFIILLIFTSCKAQKNSSEDIEALKIISEEIGKTKYKVAILYAYPNLNLDFKKIDSVYYIIK
jgi:hypothetical protein